MMRRNGQYVEEIKDLAGLAQTHPARAMILSAFMFSMAGIPPLAGFFGKMYVVLAAVGAGLSWLAAIGVITSVISGFYYIKIVKVMYFDEPAQPIDDAPSRCLQAAIAFCAAVILLFFLVPTPLVDMAKTAAEALLK
jgi:NADH-quinone oxidoreductase subunit N